MQHQHDPMERWTREGFQPEIVENAEGKFTLEFGQDGGLVPEWADWSVGPIWHESPQQAIDAALGNEAMAAAYRLGGRLIRTSSRQHCGYLNVHPKLDELFRHLGLYEKETSQTGGGVRALMEEIQAEGTRIQSKP